MIQIADIAAVAAVGGGVAALAARDSRIVVGGLLLAMLATPVVSSPEPGALALAFRFLGAMLAAYLLWAAAGAQSIASEGSGIGAGAETAAAAAAFAVGWFVVPVKPLAGPIAAQAAGFALIALAIVPLSGRNVLRAGAGATVLTLGLYLLLQAWVGVTSPLGQIAETAVLIGVVGAASLLIGPVGLLPAAVGAKDGQLKHAAPNKENGNRDRAAEPLSATASYGVEAPATQAVRVPTSGIQPPLSRPRDSAPRSASAGLPGGKVTNSEATPEPPVSSPQSTGVSSRSRHLRPREPRK